MRILTPCLGFQFDPPAVRPTHGPKIKKALTRDANRKTPRFVRRRIVDYVLDGMLVWAKAKFCKQLFKWFFAE